VRERQDDKSRVDQMQGEEEFNFGYANLNTHIVTDLYQSKIKHTLQEQNSKPIKSH
jgi:hypothetical protein